MKIFKTLIAAGLLNIICVPGAFSQTLTFTFNLSPSNLVINHLLGGGISASNITGNFSQFSGAAFSNGNAANFGFNSGIAFSTGSFNGLTGNSSNVMNTFLNTPGDPLLNLMVSGTTYDAQSLSFDFIPMSDSVEFNFVYTSEEYNESVNTSINDPFAFFITGPGFGNNTNVAYIPGTTTPISINTVNNGGPYTGTSSGPCTNCLYYIDNVGLNPVDVSYDGLTTVIKIKFSVWPCANYNLKIAIADKSDHSYDSGIFLEEQSFIASPQIQLSSNGVTAPDTLLFCAGGFVTLAAPAGSNYFWSNGDTTQAIIVSQPGTYHCMYSNGNCFAFSEVVNVVQQGTIQTPVIVQAGTSINSNIAPTPGITFQWFLDGALIPGAISTNVPVSGNGCYRLVISEGNCTANSNEICLTNTTINELTDKSILIYPNPVRETALIKFPFNENAETNIKLLDLSGKLIFNQEYLTGNEIEIETGSFENGIYFIEIKNIKNAETIFGKFIILN